MRPAPASGLAAAILAAMLLGSCSGDSHKKSISRSDMGDQWPLTVAGGIIECRNGGEVVFTANDTTYAVNGTAMGTHDYADISSIWATDPDLGQGLKKSIGPLIDQGLALC